MKKMNLLILIFSMFSTNYVFAQYFKTLPEGVRLFAYRYVNVAEVDSSFNKTKSVSPYSYKFEADAKALSSISEFKAFFQTAGLPESFSLGSYHLKAKGDVKVDGYGFGYGLTNKLTAYASLPIYKANVKLDYKRAKGNNYKEVSNSMQSSGSSFNQMMGGMIENLPDLDGPTIQSIVVNTFDYKPVGSWEGQGPGDLELGLIYNLKDETTYGFASSFGVVLPTGRIDDPDTIQDFGFGDGQPDMFVEAGGSVSPIDSLWFNTSLRYTYQFASEKNLRIPYSEDISFSDKKGTFREKLGNMWNYTLQADYAINDWFSFATSYLYDYQEKAHYESQYGKANEYLANETESSASNLRFDLTLSSITPFLKKKFILPAQMKLSYQTMIAGMNTNKIDRIEFEFRMMF